MKERFKQYEAMKRDMKVKTKFRERKDDKAKRSAKRNQSRQTSSDPKRCFNCGSGDHLSAKCPEKRKGVKCFRCNKLGYMASRYSATKKDLHHFKTREEEIHEGGDDRLHR